MSFGFWILIFSTMRISRRKRYQRRVVPVSPGAQYRANERIKSLELRIIDENGEQLGVMTTAKALQMATERELDLVEVSPLANPPVAKFIDYGAFKYQKEKEARKQKTKQIDTKGIRLSPRISEHDLEMRINQAIGFLGDGNKVKLEMVLRGRERQFQFVERAKEVINQFIAKVDAKTPVKTESSIEKQDNRLTVILTKR